MLKYDVEEGDLNLPEMTEKYYALYKLLCTEQYKKNWYSAVASDAKVLMKLIGLEAKLKS